MGKTDSSLEQLRHQKVPQKEDAKREAFLSAGEGKRFLVRFSTRLPIDVDASIRRAGGKVVSQRKTDHQKQE